MLNQEQFLDIDLHHYSKACLIVDEARDLQEKYQHDLCVRRAQEAFELLLKTLLQFIEREYPRDHDVGKVLYEVMDLLRDLGMTAERVARIVLRSKTFQVWRDRAFYGDEQLKVAHLFGPSEANLALQWANEMRADCELVKTTVWQRLLREAD